MFFSVNAPLLVTLKYLCIHPGKLFREFIAGKRKTYYKPVYDSSYSGTGVPDFRIGIHWEPFVITDKNGEAFISWYNSDDLDQFVIRVEGISNEGKAGFAEAFYKIENETND